MTRTCVLQSELYPPDILDLTEREFERLCRVQRRTIEGGVLITIEPTADAPPETPDEFLNFMLCAALERRLSA